jgi:hypothetical protein
MNVTIISTKPWPEGLMSSERPKRPYETVACGDYPYVRFLHGMGVPWHVALRYARDIEIELPRGKPIVTQIPFLGHWVPFEIPACKLRTPRWQMDHGKANIGLEWTINRKPVGLEVYSPTDWSEFNEGISNLYVGGHGWLSQEAYLPGRIRDLGNLASLALANCPKLTCIGNLANCPKLRHLFLSAERLADLDILPLLPIETLFLMDMGQLTSLDFLGRMPRVRTLVVRNCRKLEDLSGLAGHPSIRHLLLDGVPAKDLEPLGSIPSLESLHLSALPKARELPERGDLAPPVSLNVQDCPKMAQPSPENRMLGAGTLRFVKMRHWDWKTALGQAAPTKLALVGCGLDNRSLRHLPSVSRITSLDLSDNQGITNLRELRPARRLRSLTLDNCRGLQSIGGIGSIGRLEALSLTLCSNIRTILPVARCTRLHRLSLAGLQRQAQQAGALAGLRGIRQLSLAGWDRVADFGFLAGMTEAWFVDLRGRIFQENTPFASRMPRLCFLLTTFFINLDRHYVPERSRDLRQSMGIAGIPGSAGESGIRQGWYDMPREELWNPGLFLHEGHGPELLGRMTADMNSLMQRPIRQGDSAFFGWKPRPGAPPDLARRRTEPQVPQAGTPLAAIKQLQALSWANNPFDAGNGHTRLAWQLALEYDGCYHGPVRRRENLDGSMRLPHQVLREFFQALDGMAAAKPGGGPKNPRLHSIILRDPERPNAKIEASRVRAGVAAAVVAKGAVRETYHHERMRGPSRARATYITAPST